MKKRKRKSTMKNIQLVTPMDMLWGDTGIFVPESVLRFHFRTNTPYKVGHGTLANMAWDEIERLYEKHGITRFQIVHETFLEAWHPSTLRCLKPEEKDVDKVWEKFRLRDDIDPLSGSPSIEEGIMRISLSSFFRSVAAATDRTDELEDFMNATSPIKIVR